MADLFWRQRSYWDLASSKALTLLFKAIGRVFGTYFTFDITNNNQELFIGSCPQKQYSNTAIVIQGTFRMRSASLFCLKRLLLTCPESPIIVSTWTDEHMSILTELKNMSGCDPRLHVIINDKPKQCYLSNLQIKSTLAGLRFAEKIGCEYALKIRSDIILKYPRPLEYLHSLYHSFSQRCSPSQRGRILIGSSGTFRGRLFSPSDFMSFAHIKDLLLMWELKLAEEPQEKFYSGLRQAEEPFSNEVAKSDSTYHTPFTGPENVGLMGAEPYIASNIIAKNPYVRYNTLSDYEKLLATSFLIFDSSSLGAIWLKYNYCGPLSKYRTGHSWGASTSYTSFKLAEYSFADWLSLFNASETYNYED